MHNNRKAVEYSEAAPSNLPKEHIYWLAEVTASKYKVSIDTDLHKFVYQLGGRISYIDFWEETGAKISGSIEINHARDFDIYLPFDTTQERDKFTVAHELGHYFIHYLWPKSQNPNHQLGPISAPRYGSNRAEWEANWFAAAFLMPEKKFRTLYKTFKGNFHAIARRFGVSYLAVETRAKALDLISR